MAIRDLVWACVVCGQEGTLHAAEKSEKCAACGATYRRGSGAKILVVRQGSEVEQAYTARALVEALPPVGNSGSARCEIRQWLRDDKLSLFGRYLGRFERLGEARTGRLELNQESIEFKPDTGEPISVDLLDVTAVQPSSRTLQIKARNQPVFSIRFLDSSPKLWEERLHQALTEAYASAGLGEPVEFQPRVCVGTAAPAGSSHPRLRRRIALGAGKTPHRPLQYRLACWIARTVWKRLGGGLSVRGLEHIPATGPFLVLANHQSYLETMLVPAVVSRAAHMMAKSTQFAAPLTGWLMARLFAFPVRRFEIDPHAIRYVTGRLSEGYGIMIFVEGERSWDGDLQPARRGALRLALEAGVPVIPCRVTGAYHAWPRWASRPRRQEIKLRFGPPLELPIVRSRAAREAAMAEVVGAVRAALDPGQPAD